MDGGGWLPLGLSVGGALQQLGQQAVGIVAINQKLPGLWAAGGALSGDQAGHHHLAGNDSFGCGQGDGGRHRFRFG